MSRVCVHAVGLTRINKFKISEIKSKHRCGKIIIIKKCFRAHTIKEQGRKRRMQIMENLVLIIFFSRLHAFAFKFGHITIHEIRYYY